MNERSVLHLRTRCHLLPCGRDVYPKLAWEQMLVDDFVDPEVADFAGNQVRHQLFVLAHNLSNFLRRLALPKSVQKWSLRTLREKLIKIGAKVARHSKYVMFQTTQVVVRAMLFQEIFERISRLRASPELVRTGQPRRSHCLKCVEEPPKY